MKRRSKRAASLVFLFFLFSCGKGSGKDSCGDGVLDPGEECDGSQLAVSSCAELGYYEQQGTLVCRPDCRLDLTVCTGGRCGDGVVQENYGEDCERDATASCQQEGLGTGTLHCAAGCRWDTSDCEAAAICGDGVVTAPFEACEPGDLQGTTCESLGYYGGTLVCAADCRSYDIAPCARFGRCGDGNLQPSAGEECDGDNLQGATCESLDYYGGTLVCAADCRYDTTSCAMAGWCGDGILHSGYGEQCDGTALGGATCQTMGYYGGALACTSDCRSYDVSPCVAEGRCGDGIIQPGYGEQCDGTALGGATCQTMGYYGGALACASDCRSYDVSPCVAGGRCGDGIIQPGYGEQCDGNALGGATCESLGYYNGLLQCNACRYMLDNCIRFTRICAGSNHTCALRSDGTLWCWGSNLYGQLGIGNLNSQSAPVQVGTSTNWADVSAGGTHTCARRTDGTLWCWGAGYASSVPVQVDTSTNWADVSAGYSHTCARRTNGTLWCWGRNDGGQLGIGNTTNQSAPVQVGTSTNWADVSAGGSHTCARRTDGALWCWGANNFGQLGIGNTTDQLFPVQVGTSTNWASVDTGTAYTCARRTDGTLWCWGRNESGQVGIGNTTDQLFPVQVGTSTNWADVSAGNSHTCARRTDGTLWCWGANGSGQVGIGTMTTRETTPVQVSGDWGEVSTGETHTFGRKADGIPWSWGGNGYGQLGIGNTVSQPLPVQVH